MNVSIVNELMLIWKMNPVPTLSADQTGKKVYHIHCIWFCLPTSLSNQTLNAVLFFCSHPDDASEVGEEDSFLGQTSSTAPQSSTFSYFSASGGSGDPFASLAAKSCLPPDSTVVPTAAPSLVSSTTSLPPNPPISHVNSVQEYGHAVYQNPISTHTSSPNVMATPPLQASQQPFNPYRHTATSSKASPYIMAPELQQQPPHHTPQHLNLYSQTSRPPTFPSAPPTFTQVWPLVSLNLFLVITTVAMNTTTVFRR